MVTEVAVAPLPVLGDNELRRIVRLVRERSGIALHEGKRALIIARLQRRLREGAFASFSAYIQAVEEDPSGREIGLLLDAIATNHTSFFREEQHFAFLRARVLPDLIARGSAVRVWSAACATGEEPVTLACVLSEALPAAMAGGMRLLASDLSTKALTTARSGVYRLDRLTTVNPDLRRKYFERGYGASEGFARVAPPLLRLIEYRQLNLLEIGTLNERFDVIFCRNVMIYFDREVQQRVVSMLERHLVPGGYLFISHAESLNAVTHGLEWAAPAVYRSRVS